MTPPGPSLVSGDHGRDKGHRTEQNGLWRDEAGVEVDVPVEAMAGEKPHPVLAGPHIQMRHLIKVIRSRREEDRIGVPAEISNCSGRLLWGEMLQYLDATNEIVVLSEILCQRTDATVGPNLFSHLRYRPGRNINTIRRHPSRPQCSHQKPNRAAGIQNGQWLESCQNLAGYPTKRLLPHWLTPSVRGRRILRAQPQARVVLKVCRAIVVAWLRRSW